MKLKDIVKHKNLRSILVWAFIIIFMIVSLVLTRGNYIEYKELGEKYTQIFYTNLKYKYIIMTINFILVFAIIYFTNRGIKKGIKPFLEQDNVKEPKLPNKSVALIIATLVSVMFSDQILEKILTLVGNTTFEYTEPIFNLDISYYLFIKPVIEFFITYFNILIIGLTIYMSAYYILIFNLYCNGVDRKLLKMSLFFKKIFRNAIILSIGVGLLNLLTAQNILLESFLVLKNSAQTELIGAGFIEATVKLWGDILYSILIVVVVSLAVKYFKKQQSKKVIVALSTIPLYFVVFFIILVGVDFIYVNPNELDIEKDYISSNITFTQKAYNISVDEVNLDYSGIITQEEAEKNKEVISNIPIVNVQMVVNTLQDTQTKTGYYNYRNASIMPYNINGENKLVYISPREISNLGTTYNYKTYEYTHGYGSIVTSATDVTEQGTIKYYQKDIEGSDNILEISEPRIYFGMETNDTIVINKNNKNEYDYTDNKGNQYTYAYSGDAGLSLNFVDRLILATKNGNLKLALSTRTTDESKILINRNIRERAKKALSYLMYDENPYTIVDGKGDIFWVLDAYTVSNQYPYSTYTTIEYEGETHKINYIRNSVKVIINAYDGTMKFYITDKFDPIAMAYRKLYPDLFEDINVKIEEDIANKFIYPKFLYDVQAKILEVYHNVKPEILYRENDIWQFATYNTSGTKVVGTTLESYYTMLKLENNEEQDFGLTQMYTKDGKSNIIAYLVGTTNNENKNLTLYKFSSDSSILGPTQLDNQVQKDDIISKELEELNVTGAKITKRIIIVPINNTLLYIEPIYQTILNESNVPSLKKVIVSSGTKMAIGDTISQALTNLLSQNALDIEINTSEDIDSIIQAIIQANKNLTESSKNGDWEMIGTDIQDLQNLINSLEKIREKEIEQKKEDEDKGEDNLQVLEENVVENSTINE